MTRRRLLVPVVALLLPLSLAASAAADMTHEQAGDVYLSAICPGNNALDRLDRAMFGKKKTIRPRDIRGKRLKRTRVALRALERAESAGATKLLNPPDVWPSTDIAYAVDDAANAKLYFADTASDLARLRGADFIEYYNYDFDAANSESSSTSRVARARLGLPGVGEGC